MKWLLALLAVTFMVVPMFMVAPATAGEDPYIAMVGNDSFSAGRYPFYFSDKYRNFIYDEESVLGNAFVCPKVTAPYTTVRQPDGSYETFAPGTTTCDPDITKAWIYTSTVTGVPSVIQTPNPSETFRSKTGATHPEICDPNGYRSYTCDAPRAPGWCTLGAPNAKTPAGNSGWYEWYIRLPKKPSGEINLVIQCGVIKPNTFEDWGFRAIRKCAAETGERIGGGFCTREEVDAGVSPVIAAALPKITAIAYPGPYSSFTPFHLTAWKNPSAYTGALAQDPDLGTGASMTNDSDMQILSGSVNARILLKGCMDKTVVAKLPVSGQLNACSNAAIPTGLPPCFGGGAETESDLEAGDIIWIRVDVPRQNTVDVYCHALSARLQGIGESFF